MISRIMGYSKYNKDSIKSGQTRKDTSLNYRINNGVMSAKNINNHILIDSTAKNSQHQNNFKTSYFKIHDAGYLNQNKTLAFNSIRDSILADTLSTTDDSLKQNIIPKPVEMFQLLSAEKSKFSYKPLKVFIERNSVDVSPAKNIYFEPCVVHRSNLNWTLILCLICISLILGIKRYYEKFMIQAVNSIFNFQLAEKTLREKNVLARRAFFIMNLNYLLVFSLFISLVLFSLNFKITSKYYLDYLIIAIGVLSVLLIRLGVIYLNGYLFQMMPITLEYIHNIYLINKNLGIVLLPLLFASIYTSPVLSKILLTASFALVSFAALFKIIRGFQIIIKNGVLLFYSILYLCTLELLPLVIGSKLLITLR
jgi:hypothetical protein